MNAGRRSFLSAIAAAPLLVRAMLAQTQSPPPHFPRTGQPPQLPGAQPEEFPKIDQRLVLKHNQEQIKQDVVRLYDLAAELRKQVEKTDSAEILSLDLVRKAEEIEKLAKRIKNLTRG